MNNSNNELRILDLYSGAGGAAQGLYNAAAIAEYDVRIIGIDIEDQPNYPFTFYKQNALTALEDTNYLNSFDFIWASPPCQNYTWASAKHRNAGKEYADLVDITRSYLLKSDVPFVMENVQGAPLRKDLRLCGEMFGLRVIRHRIFEIEGFDVPEIPHKKHKKPITRQSKHDPDVTVQRSWYCTVSGNGGQSFSFKIADWQAAMGIDWMEKEELVESIPPAYSNYIFKHFLKGMQI